MQILRQYLPILINREGVFRTLPLLICNTENKQKKQRLKIRAPKKNKRAEKNNRKKHARKNMKNMYKKQAQKTMVRKITENN